MKNKNYLSNVRKLISNTNLYCKALYCSKTYSKPNAISLCVCSLSRVTTTLHYQKSYLH